MQKTTKVVVGIAGVVLVGLLKCTSFFSLHVIFCAIDVPPPPLQLAASTASEVVVGGDNVRTIVTSFYDHSAFTARQQSKWETLNPGWKVVGYNNTEAAVYLKEHYPAWVERLYQKVRFGPIRGDVFRVFYLAKHGGVWVDIDVMLETPIDTWDTSSTLWIPSSRRMVLLNPTVIVAQPADPTLLAATELYHSLSKTVFVGRSYWGLSVVHILSTLRIAGHQMDTSAKEHCPNSQNLYECFILGNNHILFYNRDPGWDDLNHRPHINDLKVIE